MKQEACVKAVDDKLLKWLQVVFVLPWEKMDGMTAEACGKAWTKREKQPNENQSENFTWDVCFRGRSSDRRDAAFLLSVKCFHVVRLKELVCQRRCSVCSAVSVPLDVWAVPQPLLTSDRQQSHDTPSAPTKRLAEGGQRLSGGLIHQVWRGDPTHRHNWANTTC